MFVIEQDENAVDPTVKMVCQHGHEFRLDMSDVDQIRLPTTSYPSHDSPMIRDFFCPECGTHHMEKMLV